MTQGLVSFIAFVTTAFFPYPTLISPVVGDLVAEQKQEKVLVSHSLDLINRHENEFVNQVFKDNILLALDYLGPSFVLQPGEVFAFHENILPEYKDKVVKTMGSHFMASEGYRSSGYIVGDGVCHLASLINWVASEVGLEVIAKVNHNFKPIPGIPKKFGTSIRYSPSGYNSQNQNLYIKNNFDFPLIFRFKIEKERVKLEILKK